CVQTGSAHADDFDRNKLCQTFWQTVVFVKLNHNGLPVSILQLPAAQPSFRAKSRNPGALPQPSSTGSLDSAFAPLGMTIRVWALFQFSSSSAKNFSNNPPKPARRPVGVHHLRELDQANCCRELWIFHRGRHTPCGLRVRQVGRYFENLRCEMI